MSEKIETLIERIGAKLFEIGLSEREASLDATGKPDALRYIRTRRAMPSADRLDSIAATLGTSAAWLLGKDGAVERTDGSGPPPPSPETFRNLPRNLPIYGTAIGAPLEFCTSEGEMVAIEQTEANMTVARDYMARPTGIAGRRDMYVVTVEGVSMVPRYDPGRRVLVDGKRPAKPGDFVIVQLKRPLGDAGDAEISSILIKKLVRKKPGAWVFFQYQPEAEFEVPNEKVHAVHPIMEWDDALGY